MSVLVTGDSGFIGGHLFDRLSREGYQVTGTSRCGIDLRDSEAINRLFQDHRFTEVYHLAAAGVRSREGRSIETVEVNIMAAANLARAAVLGNVSRFIYLGSGFEYASRERLPVDESVPLEPANLYAASKAAASVILQYFCRVEGLPLITLRPFSIYGPGEHPPRLVPGLCVRLLRGEPIDLTSGTQVRDYLYIDDLIEAIVAARRKAPVGSVYNLGAGPEHARPVRNFAETICRIAGRPLSLCHFGAVKPARPEPPYFVADIGRASAELAWRPFTSLEDGLARSLEWAASQL